MEKYLGPVIPFLNAKTQEIRNFQTVIQIKKKGKEVKVKYVPLDDAVGDEPGQGRQEPTAVSS